MNQPRSVRRSSVKKPSQIKKVTTPRSDNRPGSNHKPVKSGPAKGSPGLHSRNLHRQGYDFDALVKTTPALKPFVRSNPYGNLSIDFADAKAVKMLNLALLRLHYGLSYWDIPQGFLCPPIPGRVDYIHHLADLLKPVSVKGRKGGKPKPAKGNKVCALDIGTGANGIYPILGVQSYGWRFVASDIDLQSLANVQQIIEQNPGLQNKISLRHQATAAHVFTGIIGPQDRFDVTLCNPPFHASLAEANAGSARKRQNLAANKRAKGHKDRPGADKLNFGGQKAELWCEGGELAFLKTMIAESQSFGHQCLWFTSLVSKKENLKPCYRQLEQLGAATVKTIEMAQGNKRTRVLAWSFLSAEQHQLWSEYRA